MRHVFTLQWCCTPLSSDSHIMLYNYMCLCLCVCVCLSDIMYIDFTPPLWHAPPPSKTSIIAVFRSKSLFVIYRPIMGIQCAPRTPRLCRYVYICVCVCVCICVVTARDQLLYSSGVC